ncbi:MAG: hypothetical protein RKP73_17475 [Candidatus Contendobacter sp.]|nr:hypothetical protein [Candidatus Contendobacter sp.]
MSLRNPFLVLSCGGTRPWFRPTVLLATLIASGPAYPAGAGADCPAPDITAPVADATLAAARPTLRWAPVPGATGYRVRLTSRVPEGGVIASLDTLTSAPAFEPPQPLADLGAIVRVAVAARCGAETGPETSLRFFIDIRLGCPAVVDPAVEPGASGPRLRWQSVEGAERYEVLAYAAGDGRLLGRGETRELRFALLGSGDAPAVAAVRPRCRNGYGPFAFAAY